MDDILKELSQKLNITTEELRRMISQILNTKDYEEKLVDLLGYENIELVEVICKQKETFRIQQEDVLNSNCHVEYILPEICSISYDENMLVSTDVILEDKCYFEYKKFNPVQSQVFEHAYLSDENFLVCAPTGSGKTDIALLAILRALKKPKAKIAFIVPMKALATEITKKYRKKLIKNIVIEFTGDTEPKFNELMSADLIVCTPEKFDAYTRKLHNIFQDFISLVVIDEIHILQDERGPVIESIVSRLFRYIELKQRHIRIIGLSATLPNYRDVGSFLRASKLYNFDQSYRPVPLRTTIVGLFKNAKRKQTEELFVKKVNLLRSQRKQILIFVNSRHETLTNAKLLVDEAFTSNCKIDIPLNDALEYLVTHRIGIHHAGLPRNVRLFMENRFKKSELDILVCTSTLAWGVNLPAHAVIIRGTTYYDPESGNFKDLNILDIYQIFGRAGRPQYNITGEAYLFTEYEKVSNYLRLIKNNIVIESKLLSHVADVINSEVYLNSINTVASGLDWFKSTFMYVRLKENPKLYGLDDLENEDQVLSEYIFLTVRRLEECLCIDIDKPSKEYTTWVFRYTEFGRITSFYYLSHSAIKEWLERLDYVFDEESILKLLLDTKDFSNVILRKEEEHALLSLCKDLEIPYEADSECKLFALMTAFMRRYQISKFSLKCDLLYVSKNMERILNAFIEVLCFLKNFNLCKKSMNLFLKLKKNIYSRDLKGNKNNKSRSYEVEVYDCCEFRRIQVTSNSKNAFWMIIYDNDLILLIKKFNSVADIYIMHTKNDVDMEIVDLENYSSIRQSYRSKQDSTNILVNGIHKCTKIVSLLDNSNECEHICISETLKKNLDEREFCVDINSSKRLEKTGISSNEIFSDPKLLKNLLGYKKLYFTGIYNLEIEFKVIYYNSYKEFQKNFIFFFFKEYIKIKDPILIVSRSFTDSKILKQDLSTFIALRNFEIGETLTKNIVLDGRSITKNTICILPMRQAMELNASIFTIFLTCSDNFYYDVFDILYLCNKRKVVIYEEELYVKYFKDYILNRND